MNTEHINSYPSIYALGHRSIKSLFDSPIVVEEKLDGSQFSMSLTEQGLACRSKGQQIVIDAPEKLFGRAIDTAKSLDLHKGWIYRGEYLSTPKHNTLAYNRVPEKHIVIFDICIGVEEYLNPVDKAAECKRIGLECVPLIYEGKLASMEPIRAFLERQSFLGGTLVEGVVVKNYSLFTLDKKIAIGKFVSDTFKEKHLKEWKSSNPNPSDILTRLVDQLKTDARWRKGVQHLRDAGTLTNTPADIGPLIKEVSSDIHKEEAEWIREELFKYYWPKIQRGCVAGLPEFYKSELANQSFT